MKKLINLSKEGHSPSFQIKEFMKYMGPGLFVTVGFIDPGNWASNLAAGSQFGYKLLWIVTLSTIMLIILQHNAAHLGIATGLCISEAVTTHTKPLISKSILSTAMLASIATSMAEILGGAIALNMLFKIPIKIGSLFILLIVIWRLKSDSYKALEKLIIAFVSLIGIAFLIELTIIDVNWNQAIKSWVTPSFPSGSILIIMSVLGAVVMPHNLFLHSEVIQSRQWNLEDETVIKKQLKYEFLDTLFSMGVGWAINSAMILVAVTFFVKGIIVTDLSQAHVMLEPLLGNFASLIFALALLFSGLSSSVTSAIAGGSIFAGLYKEPYDFKDNHTKFGVYLTLISSITIIFLVTNPFKALVISQMLLSVQLPITIFTQIYLTSSKKVMGEYRNVSSTNITLWIIGIIVSLLNVYLVVSAFL